MKQYVTILLIAVFITAQYARQFAYLQCTLISMSTVGMQDCDCAKKADINKIADDGHPASKNHVHLTLDEFFAQPVDNKEEQFYITRYTHIKVAYTQRTCQGCANTIERPPQAA